MTRDRGLAVMSSDQPARGAGAAAHGTVLDAADVTLRLERIPSLPVHVRWAAVIGMGCFLDGFTTLIIAAALTVLISSLHIDFTNIGLLISASFFGMFCGAIVFGAASERFGRRPVFVAAVTLFGLLSIVAAFAWDFSSLFWLRVVQGFGLGGAVPVAAALISECLPASARGKTFSFTYGLLFALGFVVAPLAGLICISLFGVELGWRTLFGLAGLAFPFGIAAHWLLPESPRWLASKGRLTEASAVLQQLEQAARDSGRPLVQAPAQTGSESGATKLSEIFGSAYLGRTLLIWTLFFTIYFVQYGLNAWLPTLYVKIGGLPPNYALALTVINGCVTLGAAVLFGLTVDRVGRKTWFILGFGLSLIGIAFGIGVLALSHGASWPILFSAAVLMTAGTGVNSGSIYLYAPELFPTRMRAWATSTGSAVSRVGTIIAPIVIGSLLQAQLGLISVFALLGVVCLIGLAAIVGFGIETKKRSLEELSA